MNEPTHSRARFPTSDPGLSGLTSLKTNLHFLARLSTRFGFAPVAHVANIIIDHLIMGFLGFRPFKCSEI